MIPLELGRPGIEGYRKVVDLVPRALNYSTIYKAQPDGVKTQMEEIMAEVGGWLVFNFEGAWRTTDAFKRAVEKFEARTLEDNKGRQFSLFDIYARRLAIVTGLDSMKVPEILKHTFSHLFDLFSSKSIKNYRIRDFSKEFSSTASGTIAVHPFSR